MKSLRPWMIVWAGTLLALSASAFPTHEVGTTGAAPYHLFTFAAGETFDSSAIESCGTMSFTAGIVSGDTLTVYQLDDPQADASTGTLIVTYSASPTAVTTIHPHRSWIKVDATDTTPGGSWVKMYCSEELSDAADGGGAIQVSSVAEIEAVMRQHDKLTTDLNPVTVSIVLADDFVVDPTSADPLKINLAVGSAEGPKYNIDLGSNFINRRVDPTGDQWQGCALEINFGNVGGTCGVTAGYYQDTEGCQGVAHDYEVTLSNGSVTNDYAGCDGAPTSDCGRKAVCFNNDLLRFGTSGTPGSKYGGRIKLDSSMKLGAKTEYAGASTSAILGLPDDAAIKVGNRTTLLRLGSGIQIDAANGIEIEADADGIDTTSVFIHLDGTRYAHTASVDDEGGLLALDIDTQVDSVFTEGTIAGLVYLSNATLGHTRGGNFNLSVFGQFGTVEANCYGASDRDYFLDAGTATDEPITGTIMRNGSWCTRSAVRAGRYTAFEFVDQIPDKGVALFGSLATDTQITGAGANRFPVLNLATLGKFESASYRLHLADRSNFADIADLSDLVAADAVSGAGMNSSTSVLEMDFGSDGFYTVSGTTPDIYTSRSRKSGVVVDVTGDTGTTTGANVSVVGSTNGIDTAVSSDTVTISLDTSEIATSGIPFGKIGTGNIPSGQTLTFDSGAFLFASPGSVVQANALTVDLVGTAYLNDGADTPAVGQYVRTDGTFSTQFEYRTAAETRTDLDLVVGTNVQAYDADLSTIAALTPSAGAVMFGNGSAWVADATPAIVGTDFTGTAASLTAGAATALAADPSDCAAGEVVTGINASGVPTCAEVASLSSGTPSPPGTCTVTDTYMDTDLPGFYVCFTTDTWTLVGP